MNSTRKDWLIPAGLIALSLVPSAAGIARLAQLGTGANITPENVRFFAQPLPIVLHIPAVVVYAMLGALQFSPGFRRRNRKWHRTAGKVLVLCGLVTAVTGLWMTLSYQTPPADGLMVYIERLVVGAAMLVSLVLALAAIRTRDFASHGAWMTRAYAIGLGAGTQVLTHMPWFLFVNMKPGELPRGLMMGAGWVINILIAEWIIRRGMIHSGNAMVPRVIAISA